MIWLTIYHLAPWLFALAVGVTIGGWAAHRQDRRRDTNYLVSMRRGMDASPHDGWLDR